jgi:hypothetical protein
LKKFEFDPRKKVESDDQHLLLSRSDEVPEGFRQAIEKYYRSLAESSVCDHRRKPLRSRTRPLPFRNSPPCVNFVAA